VLAVCGVEVELPMRRLPTTGQSTATGRQPDLRFGLELRDLTEVSGIEFNAFRQANRGGSLVRGLNAGKQEMSRADLDGLVAEATDLGAKGLVWAVVEATAGARPREVPVGRRDQGGRRGARRSEGDVVLLVADQPLLSAEVLGELRAVRANARAD